MDNDTQVYSSTKIQMIVVGSMDTAKQSWPLFSCLIRPKDASVIAWCKTVGDSQGTESLIKRFSQNT